MDERTIVNALLEYVGQEILEGDDADLDAETPLLEWGLLNSMEMVKLSAFLKERFGVEVGPGDQTPEHFRSIATMTQFILKRLAHEGETA